MTTNTSTTRRRILLGVGTGATVGLAGCSGNDGEETDAPSDDDAGNDTQMDDDTETDDDPEPSGTANVRVAHMSPNAPNVDVLVDESAVLEDVAFGAVSQYLEVPAGERQVEITAAGDSDTSVFSGPVPVEADTDYTVAAVGEIGDDADEAFEPLILEDDNSGPESEMARLRLVHASPDAPAVDVTVASSGDALFDGAEFGDASYVDVPAGNYTLEVRGDTESNDGDAETSVFEGTVSVGANTDYTIVAAGEIGDMADQPFQPLVLEDDNSDPGEDMARIRTVHASPDAPAVDVTLAANGDAVFDGVPYGESGYTAVPAGEYTLDIRGDTDSNDGDIVGSFDVNLASGQVYSAFAVGYLSPDDEPAETPFDLVVSQDTGGMSGDMS